MNTESTVSVIDDDNSVRRGIANLLRAAGYNARTFASGREFLNRPDLKSGCIILDLRMPEINGLDLQTKLAAQGYHPPVIFLTAHGDVLSTATALKKGAVDFLEKPVDGDLLLTVVAEALKRDRKNREELRQTTDTTSRLEKLSAREFEVLQHVIAGRLNKQIAFALGISEKTVKVHRARVMEKMQVQSVAELVRLTEKTGVLPIGLTTTRP